MKSKIDKRLIAVLLIVALLVISAIQWGCSDRIKGTENENKKPVVYFVNVPPDSAQYSRNPVVHWFGTDFDGLVKQYRYVVVKVNDMAGLTPDQFITDSLGTFADSRWTYLNVEVDPAPNPQTGVTIRLSADLNDPVNVYVSQYIYVQAIDDKDLGSNYAWRLLERNDNPPETDFSPIEYDEYAAPFINSVDGASMITGIRLRWYGTDRMDYPTDPPPFEYQWKLFGPYTWDSSQAGTSGEYKDLMSLATSKVFVTTDGRMFRKGLGDSIIYYCDSVDHTDPESPVIVRYVCVKIYIDTITKNNSYGRLDSLFLVDDPVFTNSPYYRFVDSSKSSDNGWITRTSDTLINVFRNDTIVDAEKSQDSTRQRRFLFWIRCRDDANVSDLVPAYKPVGVVEPKYERDVLLLDFVTQVGGGRINAPYKTGRVYSTDSAYLYWYDRLHLWKPDINFDSGDYIYTAKYAGDVPVYLLLKHKVVVLYNESVNRSGFWVDAGLGQVGPKVFRAIDAGVNVWWTMRAGFQGSPSQPPGALAPFGPYASTFVRYFPLQSVYYSGWQLFAANGYRLEDFDGAFSMDTTKWPDLTVDTLLMHRRINWKTATAPLTGWRDSIGCYPEVGWVIRRTGTTPMYLYKSRYGDTHPLGTEFSFQGRPVAFRYSTSLFRTAFFTFTPMGMEDTKMQVVIDSVLNFLYDPWLTQPVLVNRYPNAEVNISESDFRKSQFEQAELLKLMQLQNNLK